MRRPLPSPRDVAAPAGWRAVELHDPFEAHVGPLFTRDGGEGERIFGFIVDERHVNEDGEAHEGMMLTFADAFLGHAANRAAEKGCVTLSMQASFLRPARTGEFVECHMRVERKTRAIIFVSGRFNVGDEDMMTATSLWKVLGER
ncbi:MAG: PaaI family thioesterase [Parvibaculaceae bacterium]|nr:PaaI family thioesterase [Parvibaculaceae bacterium]